MAWRPEEQNRLMVIADDVTGSPARNARLSAVGAPMDGALGPAVDHGEKVAAPLIRGRDDDVRIARIEPREALEDFRDDRRCHVVRPGVAQCPARRLAHGRARDRNNHRFFHQNLLASLLNGSPSLCKGHRGRRHQRWACPYATWVDEQVSLAFVDPLRKVLGMNPVLGRRGPSAISCLQSLCAPRASVAYKNHTPEGMLSQTDRLRVIQLGVKASEKLNAISLLTSDF